MPQVPQHISALAMKRTINKFIDKTCDIILGHYHCHIMKMGQIHPDCLCLQGYIDYAFPLLPDDPHANRSLTVTMVADATMTVMYQQPQALAPAVQVVLQAQAVAQPATQPAMQPAPDTTSPDVVIEEIIKITLNNDENDDNE